MIGGNVDAIIQVETSSKNAFGEVEKTLENLTTIRGFLDYASGDGSYKSNFKGELEETTHIFVCDYDSVVAKAKPTKSKMIIDGKTYDVLSIDNPMALYDHLEIMLKYNEVM